MACYGILADADGGVAFGLQFAVEISERTCLSRAAGGIVFRVKINDQSFSFEIRASDFIAGLVQTEYFGNFIACFHMDVVFLYVCGLSLEVVFKQPLGVSSDKFSANS